MKIELNGHTYEVNQYNLESLKSDPQFKRIEQACWKENPVAYREIKKASDLFEKNKSFKQNLNAAYLKIAELKRSDPKEKQYTIAILNNKAVVCSNSVSRLFYKALGAEEVGVNNSNLSSGVTKVKYQGDLNVVPAGTLGAEKVDRTEQGNLGSVNEVKSTEDKLMELVDKYKKSNSPREKSKIVREFSPLAAKYSTMAESLKEPENKQIIEALFNSLLT